MPDETSRALERGWLHCCFDIAKRLMLRRQDGESHCVSPSPSRHTRRRR
jgi:hypothetical protein